MQVFLQKVHFAFVYEGQGEGHRSKNMSAYPVWTVNFEHLAYKLTVMIGILVYFVVSMWVVCLQLQCCTIMFGC